MATLTGLGAVAVQEKQLLQGQDPIDMRVAQVLGEGARAGRWLRHRRRPDAHRPGRQPQRLGHQRHQEPGRPGDRIGLELVFKDMVENIWQASEGKDTHWEAELASTAKSTARGANALVGQRPSSTTAS
jgi:hypothetical protein